MNRCSLSAVFFLTFVLLAACGDDVTEVTEVRQDGIAVLETGKVIGTCDARNMGEMLYVTDSAEVYFCDGKTWLPTKGADGKSGANGTDGKTGKDGVDGMPGKPGEDGDDGSVGTNCTVKMVQNTAGLEGFEVTCGKNVVDTVWNGREGSMGDSGKDEAGCMLEDDGNGMVIVTCGEGDGMPIYKAMCGAKPYDPAKSFCLEDEIYELCGEKSYDPKKQYCKRGASVESYGLLHDPRDEQDYRTVVIGSQTWMAENLNYSVNPGEQSWCSGGSGMNEDDCSVYGRLYTWTAANDACPEGWRLPSKSEWMTMFENVGGKAYAGIRLKSRSGWEKDGNGDDSYGFAVLPAGGRAGNNGNFIKPGSDVYFWSSTAYGDSRAYHMYFAYLRSDVIDDNGNMSNGLSVRCLQVVDNDPS